MILVKTRALAKRVMREARGKSRVEFRRLVQRYSRDRATMARGGDLRYLDRQGNVWGGLEEKKRQVSKAIAMAAWKLTEPGSVGGPVRTRRGWHVLYLTGRRPARKRTFDQARLHIVKRVRREKWSACKRRFIDKHKQRLGVSLVPGCDKRLRRVRVGPGKLPARVARLVLARIGKEVITVGDLSTRINRMSRWVRDRYRSLEKRRDLLGSMVEFEVLARVAQERELARDPAVARMLRQVMIQRLREIVMAELVPIPRGRKLSEAKAELLREERRTAFAGFQKRLRTRAQIRIHEDRLAAVPIDLAIR